MPKRDKFWIYACLIALIGLLMLMNVATAHAFDNIPDTFDGLQGSCTQNDSNYNWCGIVFTPDTEETFTTITVPLNGDAGSPDVDDAMAAVLVRATIYTASGSYFGATIAQSEYIEASTITKWSSFPLTEYSMVDFEFPDTVVLDSGTTYYIQFQWSYNTVGSGTYYNMLKSSTSTLPTFWNGDNGFFNTNFRDATAGYGGVFSTGDAPPPEPVFGDLTILYPTYATTTASTTIPVVIGYTIGDDLSEYSLDGSLPVRIGIELSYDDLYNAAGYTYLPVDWDISSTTGAHGYTVDLTLPNPSDYSLVAKLILDYGFIPPFEGCTPNPPFVSCTGSQSLATYQWDEATFSAVNGAIDLIGFQPGGAFGGGSALATTTCNIANISGCFQNAITFLFFPSPDALATFSFLWENIRNKPPFGYVSQTVGALTNLSEGETAAFTFGELPFVDEIFTPLKNGLEGLLWISLIVGFLYRLRELDI